MKKLFDVNKMSVTLAALLGCSAAVAQSSVTLYGRLDTGVQYVSDVATASGGRSGLLESSSSNTGMSVLGIDGTEDLGDGYKAVFRLRDYIIPDQGLSLAPFWGVAYIGMSGPFGAFRMGQDDSIMKDGTFDYDTFHQSNIGMNSLVEGANWPNFSNTFSYYSPRFAGFDVGFQYSLGGVAGQFNSGRSDGLQLTYHLEAFSARAIYQEARDANGQYSDLYTSQRQLFVGTAYDGAQFKVQAAYTFMAAPQAAAGSPRYADYGWVGFNYKAPGPFGLSTGIAHIHLRDGQGSATILLLGPTYSLSKSTTLYTTAGYVFNGKNTDFSAVAASPTNLNPAIGHGQLAIFSGIMHYF